MQANADKYPQRKKDQLPQLLLDLCGFTLDKAGYDSKAYAFYLSVALRHQAITQDDVWNDLSTQVANKTLDEILGNEELLKKLIPFAQTIVAEVMEANQDNWAVKLIKTSYLSQLDKARKSSELAIKRLNSDQIHDFSLSTMLDSSDNDICNYTEALKAHTAYLDSLLALPFRLEKLCFRLAKNNPALNYLPIKTAEMLAATLDTINNGLHLGEAQQKSFLIEGIKLAVQITMPNVPFDDQLVKTISTELLPFINQVIVCTRDLNKAKQVILNDKNEERSLARQQMLNAMDVHFYSVQDILKDTLLKPAEQFQQVFFSAKNMAIETNELAKNKNKLDQAFNIKNVFAHFDEIALVCAQLDPSLLPTWLTQANAYYNQIKDQAANVGDVVQDALNGLGAFYNYAAYFIPKALSNYLAPDLLGNMLSHLKDAEIQPNFHSDSIMAYFTFYALAKQSATSSKLNATFFTAYMDEVVKKYKSINRAALDYAKYQDLEKQLDEKGFNLDQPLDQRIKQFNHLVDFTNSIRCASIQALGISDPQTLDIVLLIHRLQTIELSFNVNNAEKLLEELDAAFVASSNNNEIHQIFSANFLQPAIQRLFTQYQNEQLVPWLEEMLDSRDPRLLPVRHEIRVVYSKLKEQINLSVDDIKIIANCNKKLTNDILFNERFNDSILVNISQKVYLKDSQKKLPEKTWQTPKQLTNKQVMEAFETAQPVICLFLDQIQIKLSEQKISCDTLVSLTNNEAIKELCDKKSKYIDELNGLINGLKDGLSDRYHPAYRQLNALLENNKPELIQQQFDNLSLASIPGQLIRFAWNVLPSGTNKIDENMLLNFLNYYFKDSNITNAANAQAEFVDCLNSNPVPALIKKLNDPLAIVNVLPGQEQIIDAVVDQLISTSANSVYSWSTNYLTQVVASLSQDHLIKLLPYPFVTELVLHVLQSNAVQDRIAPIVNSLINEYGGMVVGKAAEFKEAAKNRLYPTLGIEIQKTVELEAYHYVLNPEKADQKSRDSFAMYYLQYRALKQSDDSLNSEAIIRFLFPDLLASKIDDNVKIRIKKIQEQCEYLDKLISKPVVEGAVNPINETAEHLLFLLEHFDLSEHENEQFIQLALFNQLLITLMDTADQLKDNNAEKARLQQTVIMRLSSALEKINTQKAAETMTQALSVANKRAIKIQLQQVNAQLEATQKLVEDQQDHHVAMVEADKVIPLFEQKVYQSWTWQHKLGRGFLATLEFLGIVATWAAMIGSILSGTGVLQMVFVALGLAGTVGAFTTVIGAIVLGALILVGITVKFGLEIWERKAEFKIIAENPSLMQRIGLYTLLVLKCLGLAVLKTFITHFIFNKINNLFAVNLINEGNDALRPWPSKNTIDNEKNELDALEQELTQLQKLVKQQIDFVENKKDSKDLRAQINEASKSLKNTLIAVEFCLNQVDPDVDARFTQKNYQAVLNSYKTQFEKLTQEIGALDTILSAQINLPLEPSVYLTTQQKDPVEVVHPIQEKVRKSPLALVDLDAYKQQIQQAIHQSIIQSPEAIAVPTRISLFWNYLFGNPPIESEKHTDLTLSISGFVYIEQTDVVENMIDSFFAIASESGIQNQPAEVDKRSQNEDMPSISTNRNSFHYSTKSKREPAETTAKIQNNNSTM